MSKQKVAALLVGAAMFAAAPAFAQIRGLNPEQQLREQALSKVVDQVAWAHLPAPADVALRWQNSFIGGERGQTYIPYVIGIDGKFDTKPVAMYVRVLTMDATPPDLEMGAIVKEPTAADYGPRGNMVPTKVNRGTGIASESILFFEQPRDGRLVYGMSLMPGEYDVYVGMQEKPGKGPTKTAVLKQHLVVPDLSKGLSVSSLIVADSLEPVPPSTRQRNQLNDPYAIAGTRIKPAASDRLRKDGELTVVFFVYHPLLGADGKPSVEADYTFYAKNGAEEKVFVKSAPQVFDAQTLAPDFDPAIHQIMGGQVIPLGSFPAGDYRLEVKVTDKIGGATATTDTTFSVFGQ